MAKKVLEAVHPHGEHVCVCSECKAEITVKEGEQCNTVKCPECGAPMVAKQAGERRGNMISDKEKASMLQAALVKEYGMEAEDPRPKSLKIEEVFADRVIYNVDGQLYESPFTLSGDEPEFGEAKKVTSTKIFTKESLQETYSELIQEAGKRNAVKDAARVKKILELCQELLSSEDADEKKLANAAKEAVKTLTWIKTLEAMKTEDGVQYPAAAFAYAPDVEMASAWKLRMWEDTEKKVTRAQLGRAAAALSPGGFRGQKVSIPSADLSSVKRKIRAEYRKLDVEEAEIPRWVKESMTRELVQNYIPLTEATFDKGRATVIVIKPGFNATEDRYYPAEMLKRDYKVFEGQKMYADHPTEQEDHDLPERSIKNTSWVAVLKDVSVDESGVVTGVAEIIEPWLMTKLATLRDKQLLSEMGISINAIGRGSKATIEGKETLVIEELTGARSVDFVTEPGAGGTVTLYESDRSRDIDLVELSGLKEKRPDLVKLIETDVRAVITQEVKTIMEVEERITELEGQLATVTTERDGLKEATEKAAKDLAIAEAQATIKEAVEQAELPAAAKTQLLARFATAESADGITEAITAEANYIAQLSESGVVKGLGPVQPVNTEADHAALKESFIKLGLSEEVAEAAATGR